MIPGMLVYPDILVLETVLTKQDGVLSPILFYIDEYIL